MTGGHLGSSCGSPLLYCFITSLALSFLFGMKDVFESITAVVLLVSRLFSITQTTFHNCISHVSSQPSTTYVWPWYRILLRPSHGLISWPTIAITCDHHCHQPMPAKAKQGMQTRTMWRVRTKAAATQGGGSWRRWCWYAGLLRAAGGSSQTRDPPLAPTSPNSFGSSAFSSVTSSASTPKNLQKRNYPCSPGTVGCCVLPDSTFAGVDGIELLRAD